MSRQARRELSVQVAPRYREARGVLKSRILDELQENYGVSPQLFSVLFGLNALGLMVASQVNGRLVGRRLHDHHHPPAAH
jgi:hypothetical protein